MVLVSITRFLFYSVYTRTLNIIIGWLSKTFEKFLDYLIIVAMIPQPPPPQIAAAAKKIRCCNLRSKGETMHFNNIITVTLLLFGAATVVVVVVFVFIFVNKCQMQFNNLKQSQ